MEEIVFEQIRYIAEIAIKVEMYKEKELNSIHIESNAVNLSGFMEDVKKEIEKCLLSDRKSAVFTVGYRLSKKA